MERFSRLSNVSAALLHIAMRNMGTENPSLAEHLMNSRGRRRFIRLERQSDYDTKGLWIGGPSSPFLVSLSERIASLVPHLLLTSCPKCAALCRSQTQPKVALLIVHEPMA